MSFASKTWAVFKKDMQSEFRSRYAINSIALFCLTCVFVVSFAMKGATLDSRMSAATLWVIMFFSAMSGLSRTFIKEEDQGTMNTLRLTCSPMPLFLGKALMNLALMFMSLLLATPLFLVLMDVNVPHPLFLVLTAAFAGTGMAAICALLSGLVAGARARGMLFPVLAFPILLPVFWIAVDATDIAFMPQTPWESANLLMFLASYAVAALVGGGFLFEYIFTE